jgi:hypothetical protein
MWIGGSDAGTPSLPDDQEPYLGRTSTRLARLHRFVFSVEGQRPFGICGRAALWSPDTVPSVAMAAENPVVIAPARYVLLPLANLLTGYSVKAMERKIERGDWQEGKVWRRAPDGRILIDVMGYQRWVEDDYRR